MSERKPLPPVLAKKCRTCPFRRGGRTFVAPMIAASALTEGSRICHSTGKDNLFHKDTGKPERLCRGARDIQLAVFHAAGVIESATDAAWDKAWGKMKK